MLNSQMNSGCCLKMASRCRQTRDVVLDGSRLPPLGSSHHDCGSLEQVVMVRKHDHRQVISQQEGNNQQIVYETYQTFRGHKPQTSVTYRELCTSTDGTLSELSSGIENMAIDSSSTSTTSMSSTSQSSSASSNDHVQGGGFLQPKLSLQSQTRSQSASPATAKKVAVTTARPGSAPNTTETFERDCLERHNEYRRKHDVPALKLNKKLCKNAEEWASNLARRGVLQHRCGSRYGENIFCVQSSAPIEVTGQEPVDNWYSEVKHHTFNREPSSLRTGHFTQVVWRDSKELGVAMARNRNGQVFVVANYDPPGNFIGSFEENVPPVGGFQRMPAQIVATDTAESSSFAQEILRHHNEYRRKHSAQPLALSEELNGVAQRWADSLAKSDRFGHNPKTSYGENIYCLWSSDKNAQPNPKAVCQSWYQEIRDFRFGTEPQGLLKAGHFTQMVWKGSQKLGVGKARTHGGKVVVVCNYEPRGNVIGHYKANVHKG